MDVITRFQLVWENTKDDSLHINEGAICYEIVLKNLLLKNHSPLIILISKASRIKAKTMILINYIFIIRNRIQLSHNCLIVSSLKPSTAHLLTRVR